MDIQINARDIVTSEQKLLYLMLQELKEINVKLTPAPKPTAIDCKYCGGTHENNGQVMACAKKMKKKEGAKNDKSD
jgi:hypothetical protein